VSEPTVTEIGRIAAPFRREIVLQDVLHESGLRLLRVRIREGTRFTILDIDAPTAEAWAGTMLAWSRDAAATPDAGTPAAEDGAT
jgi:hypothetical protein